ncbi:uncharacterized protein FPRO_02158 [Fusarium proliferatum ET1]|uniref:Nucleoside phosphorylase domain-containing protein n=1 Tax=Fusarium proliferatum (strain ET1) TaxID=1227346 RepID=A0A1L7V9Y0_FUSPR|nr:uncharacterized protein FPRO_02158 [Fusarium proliferatum ET1]CZR37581.1 uncharacterized protein FPRO_02158 [Fusarium proliferatum ET1]
MGIANAAAVASNCGKSFPGIKLALVVGVCGAVPFKPNKDEIVLGDVIISDGIVQCDFGRQLPGRFACKDMLAEYPGVTKDRLFDAFYRHAVDQKSCEQLGCNGELVLRHRLETAGIYPAPAVHFGLMASGNSVMKSGEDRDRIAVQEGVIGFEMEGAGVWDSFPCIVIKGACDYADSHKDKGWQRYAAATAAACTKAFLGFWVPSFGQGLAWDPQNDLRLQNRDSSGRGHSTRAVDEGQIQPVFYVPFLKNDLFVGRDDVLVALQIAYWIKEAKKDYLVFWVPALSHASFEQACMQIIDACGIPTTDNSDAIETVCQHLCLKSAGKWLLVVDNADNMQTVMGSKGVDKGLYRSLPQSDQGRILFTTRYRKVAVSVAGRNILDVPAMGRDEARSYFKQALIQEVSSSDEQVMNYLLMLLTYLPLAITKVFDMHSLVYMAIRLWVVKNDLEKEQSDAVIARLREVFLTDDWENRDLWRQYLPHAIKLLRCADDGRVIEAVKLLEHVVEVRETMLAENHPSRLASQHALAGAYQANGQIAKAVKLLEHVVKVKETTLAENRPSRLASQHALAGVYEANGQIAEAVKLLEHVVKVKETTLAENHPDRLASQHALAGVYQANRQIAEAVKLLEHVVKVKETTLAENHLSRLASQHALAGAYQANGQIAEAVKLLEHVVKVEEMALAENHPDRLASQHELARAYQANRQIAKAVKLLEHVVTVSETTLAENHPDRLASQHALAGVYRANGQIAEAVKLLEHVVTVRETALAENHPSRLASQHELAGVYQANGQIAEAVKLLEHVVARKREIMPPSHPSRLVSEHNLQYCREILDGSSSSCP